MNNHVEGGGIFGLLKLVPQNYVVPSQDEEEVSAFARSIICFWLVLYAVVSYRNMSTRYWDWWRLLLIYSIGTFIFSFLASIASGVTRMLWFGVLAHNIGELYMIKSLLAGLETERKFLWVLAGYIFGMTIVLIIIPVKIMFLILEIQGAALDWYIPVLFILQKEPVGVAASLTHLVQIQAIFYGLNSGNKYATLLGLLLIGPWFGLYMWYAKKKAGGIAVLGPYPDKYKDSQIEEVEVEMKRRSSMSHDDSKSDWRGRSDSPSKKKDDGESAQGEPQKLSIYVEGRGIPYPLLKVYKWWHLSLLAFASLVASIIDCFFVFYYIN